MDQTTTVLVIATSPSWHRNVHCQALDTAVMATAGHEPPPKLREVTIAEAGCRPCLVCADSTFEWTVTQDNIFELWEIVGPSKPHYGSTRDGVVLDGLTIWEHGGVARTVARVGDTIRFRDGLYRVTHTTAQEA